MRRFFAWATVASILLVSRASAADNYLAEPFERKIETKSGLPRSLNDGDRTGQLRGTSTPSVAATHTDPEKTNVPYGDTATAAPRPVEDGSTGVEHKAVTSVILPWEVLGNLHYTSTKSPTPKSTAKRDELQQHESVFPGVQNNDKGAELQKSIDRNIGLPDHAQKTTFVYSPETNSEQPSFSPSSEKTRSPSTSILHDERASWPYNDEKNLRAKDTEIAASYFPSDGEKLVGAVLAVGIDRETGDTESHHDYDPALPERDNWAVWQVGLPKTSASTPAYSETNSPDGKVIISPGDEGRIPQKSAKSDQKTTRSNTKQSSLSDENSRTTSRSVVDIGVHDVDVIWAESPSHSSAGVPKHKTDENGNGDEHHVGRTNDAEFFPNAEKRNAIEEGDSAFAGNPKAAVRQQATDNKIERPAHTKKSSQTFETPGYSTKESPGGNLPGKTEVKGPTYTAALGSVVPWDNDNPSLGGYDAMEKLKVRPRHPEATAYTEEVGHTDITSKKTQGYGKLLGNTVPRNEHYSLFSRDLQSEERVADEQPSDQPSMQPSEESSEPATEQSSEQSAIEDQPGEQPSEQPSEKTREQATDQSSEQSAIKDSDLMKTTVVDVRWDQDDCHPCDVPTEPPTLAPVYPYNKDDYESHLPNVTEVAKQWEELKENESSYPSTRTPAKKPKKPKKPHKTEFVHCMKVIGEYGQYYECENNSSETTVTETPVTETGTPSETPLTDMPNEDTTWGPYEPTPLPTEPDKPSELTPAPTDPTKSNEESTPAPTKPGETTPAPTTLAPTKAGESTPAPTKPNEESTPAPIKPGEATPAPTTLAPTKAGESTPASTKLTPSPTEPGESTPAPTKLTPSPSKPGESTPAPTKSYDEPTPTPAASTTDGEISTTYPMETKASASKTTKPATTTGTNSSTGTTTDKTGTVPPTSVSTGDTYANTTDSTTTGTDAGSGNTIVTGISTGGASSGNAALGGGAIAGIVIACVVFVIIVVGAVLIRQRSIARQREENLFADLTAAGGRTLETDYAAM